MIELQQVSFSYGRHTILPQINMQARPGECTVIAGPNGSGKTTLLSLIAGIRKPTGGTILRSGAVGYVPQGAALLPDATVEENLRFFAALAHAEVPEQLPFAIDSYRKKRVSRLSGGMKKQVSIACALLGDPPILLLDEPCAALDIHFRDALIDLIGQWKGQNKTILYVGHDPVEFYPFFDQLLFLTEEPELISRSSLSPNPTSKNDLDREDFYHFFSNKLHHESR